MKDFIFDKIRTIIVIAFLSCVPQSTLADTVIGSNSMAEGKIRFVNGGLIVINEDRTDKTFIRTVGNEYFEDEILYKKYFFSFNAKTLFGRIENLNRQSATILTPDGKIELQRYKIKNIIMNTKQERY